MTRIINKIHILVFVRHELWNGILVRSLYGTEVRFHVVPVRVLQLPVVYVLNLSKFKITYSYIILIHRCHKKDKDM